MNIPDIEIASDLQPGYQLGPYKLLEQLGHGGQALVWSAWHEKHTRVVAIKLVPTTGSDPLFDVRAFDHETRIVATLTHPNILPVYDFGTTGKMAYLVMRYLPKGSLEDLLKAGPLSPPETLQVSTQIVSALDYIHRRGVVHRDLKPSNILLDTRQRAFLTDFGLARPLSPSTRSFHTGRGSAPYSPPEQHTKAEVTHKSDIYSLGLVLFQLLLLPFARQSFFYVYDFIHDFSQSAGWG